MASQPKLLYQILIPLLLCVLIASAQDGSIAVYWGQNWNSQEGTLKEACDTGYYAYVSLAFLDTFGNGSTPVLNLPNHCSSSTGDCTGLATDIEYCQAMGIQVFLSLGGGGGNYTLSSPSDAESVAQYLWNNYLGGTSANRPLGSAVLNGIDFDTELGGTSYYDDLAKYLSAYSSEEQKVFLSAAPGCPYPDFHLNEALSTGLFEYVWVQFYNDQSCQYETGDITKLTMSWNTWVNNINATNLFVGLPASPAATVNGGYIPPDILKSEVLPVLKQSPKYGGLMLWQREQDVLNGYSAQVKSVVLEDPVKDEDDTLSTTSTCYK